MKLNPSLSVLILLAALWNTHVAAQTPIPNPQTTDSGFFGWSIAAASGNRVLVGAVNNVVSGKGAGAAYVLDSATGSVLKTIPNPEPADGDKFGTSIATLGNNVIIGAPAHRLMTGYDGAAYLFDISNGAKLKTFVDPAPAFGNYFGTAVALVGNTALVGSPRNGSDAAVHQFDITTGAFLRSYQEPGPAFNHFFGSSIATANGRMLVGSYGDTMNPSVQLFDSATGDWLRTINGPVTTAGEAFGFSVALTDRWAVIGSPQWASIGTGVVYLFDVSTGNFLRTLNDPSPKNNSQFGDSVFALGDYVLVGADEKDRSSINGAGVAYLFNGLTGDLLATYVSPNPEAGDLFGNAVALVGGKAYIGARSMTTNAPDSGGVFSFPSVFEPGLIGDYDANGIVDSRDYLIWRHHVGQLVPACSRGDANCNGFTEVGEYQPWRANWGRVAGGVIPGAGSSVSSSAALVPETSSQVLMGLTIIGFVGGYNRRMNCRSCKRA